MQCTVSNTLRMYPVSSTLITPSVATVIGVILSPPLHIFLLSLPVERLEPVTLELLVEGALYECFGEEAGELLEEVLQRLLHVEDVRFA